MLVWSLEKETLYSMWEKMQAVQQFRQTMLMVLLTGFSVLFSHVLTRVRSEWIEGKYHLLKIALIICSMELRDMVAMGLDLTTCYL